MSTQDSRRQELYRTAEILLELHWTRLVLSLLIIVSVLPDRAKLAYLPEQVVAGLDTGFLVIFSFELLLRLTLYSRRWRERRARLGEALLLLLDLVAVISFLPLEGMIDQPGLRLMRLARLLLLVGYWGRIARDLLAILAGPERRYQVIGLLFIGLVLSFGGAVVISTITPDFDIDEDGIVSGSDRSFARILWWSFRQVQDTGNLVESIDTLPVVIISLLLTTAGLLLFSLLIGIGTGAIEELLSRSREQPLALHNHTVVLGLTPHSMFLLEGLADIYRKNLSSFRAAVLGPNREAPAYLHGPLLRSFQYRHGDPVQATDLERVSIRRAKRVLILGSDAHNPDGEVISAILAARERNPNVDLYPDVEHERNFRAVRSAGGPRTHIVGSGSFLGHYIVHNIVYPGAYHVYRQLLTSSGSEVYTYLFSDAERRRLSSATGPDTLDPAALHRLAYRRYGVTSIGLFTGAEGSDSENLRVVLNPARAGSQRSAEAGRDAPGELRWSSLRGLAGISLRWEGLRRLGQAMADRPDVGQRSPLRAADFDNLRLRPACHRVERVLILGASLRVPRTITELACFFPRLEVTVLVRNRAALSQMAHDVRTSLDEAFASKADLERDAGAFTLELEAAAATVHVLMLEGDWTDQERLRQMGAVDLESADAILLLPGTHRIEEGDGVVALDSLHIANLARSGELKPRPDLHVLCMVRDAVKGDLLESRLQAIAGPGDGPRFTVISSERVRHHFIMQNVFVRNLNPLYLELLNAAGQHLGRVLPRHSSGGPMQGAFDPAELANTLLLVHGMVFLGLEVDDGAGGFDIELDPKQMPPGELVPWSSVRALYVLASWRDLQQLEMAEG
ncbi:MAG: ion transporter [Acidobacteriota bacterium]